MWNWGPLYSDRENIQYDYLHLQVRVLDWWATTPGILALSTKDCSTFPSYVHANIGETPCMLAARPDLVNKKEAVNQDHYSTFFEYRMDRYSKSGVVGRETTQATTEFGEKIFATVVDNLSHMI
jgi:creatinine amidohydrolase/Fe(II)-dependent formamide hydrolase-like protein